ncbi:unnamed protein product [Symbiodinium sp. CCMP2592]|nr:unnamed protein product [Symbiodinium sp. CCMP2592]
MRIWTLNVPVPVDLPWRPQGYPTRWLRELMCRLHHIDDPGEFRSTLSSPGGTVQHVLFVPIVPTTHPTARFWLLHWGDAAVVTFGHTPFHWDVVSAHIRALFPGGPLPDRCPALSFAGQFYPPGAPLPDFPSGAVIQIIIGALARIPGDDDPWNPDPLVVDSPFFRHVPSRGPALEPAIRLDGSGNQLAAGALQTPLVDQGVQTDLSGNGTGLDHATVSRVHLLSRELSFHTSRLWAGLAEPDAEPVGDSPSVLRLSSQSACAAASAPNVDLLDIGGTSGSHKLALPSSVSWVLVGALLGFRGVASGSFLALATVSDGSIIFPPPDCSDEEQSDEEGPPPVQAENMSVASGAPVPFTIPAGPPPPEPVNAPFQPRLRYLRAARPLEDYALGLWPSTLDREPAADEDVVRRVQADLLGLQRGLRTFAAAIPLGTPFCIHNPFTARQQCDIVEYSAGPELNPFVLFQGHARSRGWAGMVLLMPQPDATAVHLIGCPQAPGNVAVGVVIDGRLLPCCLPACVACAALQALHLDGQEYDLRPPDVHEETAVVQFRNGDCLAAGRRPSRQLPSHQDVQAATAETLGGGTDDAATVPGSTSAAFRAAGLWVWLVVTSARSHGVAPAMLALCLWRAEVLGMHRPGGFPWGIDPVNRRFSGITSEDPVEVVLHSPFLGVFPPFTASQDTCHTQAWAQFRTADPGWAADYFPVWPGPAFNELSVVPVGHDPALVTIMLVWGGHHRATLTPRTMTVAWLTSFVARHINSEVGGLSLPHGLAVCEYFDIPPAAFRFRNGDVVYIHDPPADPDEPLEFVEPWHLQDGLAAHHAPWAVGFQLMFPISVHLLRPEKPPLLTSIPAGESWCPEAFSFSGDFRHQFPGFWTPVQWTSARALQLMAVNEVAAKVNVVAATPEGRLCRSVDRVVSRDSLAAQLRFCPATVQVGGVPSYAMEQACELRNGDVIFGEFARGACATASCRLGWWLGTAFAFSQLPMARQFLLVLAVGLMHGGQSSSLGAGALFFLPSAAAMIQRAPAAPLATPAIPAATVNRVTLTLANPFAPWQRVEVDPSNAFEDVIADAHHTLTSWHRGFAESGLVSDGSHVLVPRPGGRLACILVSGLGQLICVVVPSFLTPRDLTHALQLRFGRRVSAHLSPGLAASTRDTRPVLALRSGDLIAVRLFQSDPSAGPRETPVFLTWGAAHAASAWHSDFIVAHASCVLLWSPSRPTRVALLRHQARWNAAEATVCQHEEALGVHRWAPCHGHLGTPPWLVEQATAFGRVNIIQSRGSTRLLRKPVYATAIGGFIPLQLDCLVVGYLRWPDFCSLCMVSVGQPGLCPPAPRADVPVLTLQKLAPFAPGCRLGGVAPVIGTALTAIFLRESISAVVNLMSCRRGGSLIVLTVSFVLPAAFQVQGPWSLFEAVGSRHCGAWATRFFPVRAAFPFAQVTLAPVAPFGMASVVFHTLSGTAVALASVDASLEDIQRLAARLIPSTRFWVVIPPPSIRAAHMYTHIRLRNGDAFGFLPDSTQPGSTRFPALHYPSLDRARQVASWSLSFRFDTGGPVTLWTTSSRFGQLVYVRDNAYWDPLGPTFRSLGGETLTGSWVPVLTGDLSDLHLMSRTSISEAHVLFLLPPEQTPVGVFLAGCNTHRIPLGWQLLPAIRYVRAGSTLRDGVKATFSIFRPDLNWILFCLACEPAWGADVVPVWPTAALPALLVVPRPPDPSLVCLAVSSLDRHFSVLIPCSSTLSWLGEALRFLQPLQALSLRAPSSLAASTPHDGVIRWRSGDLVVALPPAAFEPTYQPPCFHTDAQVRHCAVWAVDFSVSVRTNFILWRPGVRAIRGHAPEGAQWRALDFTFAGDFCQHYPGRWVPVPWIAQDHAHLVVVSEDPTYVNVVIEADGKCWCAPVTAATDAWQLWNDVPSISTQPRVLGLSHQELRQGTVLRNGDVVSEAPQGALPSGGVQALLAFFLSVRFLPTFPSSLVLIAGLFFGWHNEAAGARHLTLAVGLAATGQGHVEAVRMSDTPYPAGECHRLWEPSGSVSGPFFGPVDRPPEELRHAAVAWSDFTQVRPPQDPRIVDWVPVPSDPLFVVVLLQCPPATRAAILPATCHAADLTRACRRSVPDLACVLASPEIWCGTATSYTPTLFLRSGDVLTLACAGWAPRLRSPSGRYWDTFYQARKFAFWGSPFQIRLPGLLFAWSAGDPVPLTVHTVQNEVWDPEHCTFRPSLARYSVARWIPAARCDLLGLHLVPESLNPHRAHVLPTQPPLRLLEVSRYSTQGLIRDGDSGSFGSRAPSPRLLLCLAGLLLTRNALSLWASGGALLLAGASFGAFPFSDTLVLSSVAHGAMSWPALLFDIYGRAWGAPSEAPRVADAAAKTVPDRRLDLNEAGHHYAGLAAHYLARHLLVSMPPTLPPCYHSGWLRFSAWPGGVPDELFIATDGSGLQAGGWAFAVWALWKKTWFRVGWDAGSLPATPWLPTPTATATDLRSYLGELSALVSAAAWFTAWQSNLVAPPISVMCPDMPDVAESFFNREGHGQRRIYIAQQLQSLDVHVAFLQECRSRPGRWSSHGFLSFRSGAEKGMFGVEIWVRPDVVSPKLDLDDFRIRFASPRLLLVQCQRSDFPVTLVAAHAPHAERPEHEIRRFWQDLRVQLLPACNRGVVLAGIDANADFVGRDEEEVLVGDLLSLRPARLADDLLLACLHDTSLAAPGTWAETHSGPSWTWQHTGGKVQRLDHLLVTGGVVVRGHRQFPELDILNGEDLAPLKSVSYALRTLQLSDCYRRDLRCAGANPTSQIRLLVSLTPFVMPELSYVVSLLFSDSSSVHLPFMLGTVGHHQLLLGAGNAHAQARIDKQAYFESLLVGAIDHWHATGRPLEAVSKLSWASKGAKQKRDVRAASGFNIDAELQLQFQQQEGGRPVSSAQLNSAFAKWADTARPVCPAAVPSLLDVEHMCRSQKRGKAPGPDHIRNEVWKACPDKAGRWLWPIWLHLAWGEAEPLHFKASIVGALHKKGPAHLPSNFRSIAMLNGVAKLWHSQLRATLGQEIIAHYFPTQLGGRRGVDTGLALGVFRSAVDLGRDLDEALQGLRLPEHVHGLIRDGVLSGLGVPPDQIALLRDCVECSFWRLVGQPQAILASRGSRPGDGLADVLFGALFAVILQCLHHALRAEDIVHASTSDALGNPDTALQIAWADDLCLLVDFLRATWAVSKLQRLCSIVLQVFEAFRFRVNLGAGKTEALVHLQGPGANEARKELLSPVPQLHLTDGRCIRVVPEYKYLGVAQRCRDTGRRDIEAAASRGNAIWTQAAGLVHSDHLPWVLKLVWLQGRTLPAAYSSLATTLAHSERAWGPLQGFLDKCLRQLVGAWDAGHHVASAQLRACTGVLDVECATLIARVRLLCRIVSGRSAEVFDLFQASWDRGGEWSSLLADAVRKVWPACGLPDLRTGEPTLEGIRRHSKAILAACRKISRSGTMLLALHRAWNSRQPPSPKKIIGVAAPHVCPECGVTLPSAHALAAHLHRLHGRVALCTQYTLGTVCLWCLIEFHNAARLRYHLLNSPACEHGLRCCVGPVYVYGSGTKRRGQQGHARAPVFRLTGPCNATPAQRRAAEEDRNCTAEELAAELHALAPGPGFAEGARSSPVVPFRRATDPAEGTPVPPTGCAPVAVGLAAVAHAAVDGVNPPNEASSPLSPFSPHPPPLAVPAQVSACLLSAFFFDEFPDDCDLRVPSCRWSGLAPGLWCLPCSWNWCWRLFCAFDMRHPWSGDVWRLSAFLRREERPSALPRLRGPSGFGQAAASRILFLRRMLTFLHLIRQLQLGAVLWSAQPLPGAFWELLGRVAPAAVGASAVSVLGFGSVVSLPGVVPSALAALSAGCLASALPRRLAFPHQLLSAS